MATATATGNCKKKSPETADKTTAGSADGARYGFCPYALVSTGIYSLESVTRNCRLATRLPRGQELSSTSLQRLSATKPLIIPWRGMHGAAGRYKHTLSMLATCRVR
jgi:hypothetical protein